MTDLIARLESAPEGSRELDVEIATALYPELERRHASYYLDDIHVRIEDYTTSLDAALTLVPDDLWLSIQRAGNSHEWLVEIGGVANRINAPTPALCIAAIKAREAAGRGCAIRRVSS